MNQDHRASVFLNSFFACDKVELYTSLTKCIVRREIRDISQTNLGTNMRARMRCASLMNIQLFSSSLVDASAFLEDFERLLLGTRNWNSPHCFQNTFFCSMKRQNVTLHRPSSMSHYGLGIHTILSSLCSKENFLGIIPSPVSVLLL